MKTQVGTTVAVAAGALALASPALAAGPLASYRDAPARADEVPSAQTSISGYSDANERSQLIRSVSTTNVVRYLDAGERSHAAQPVASAPLDVYLDAFERGEPVRGARPVSAVSIAESGFDWGAAAIGASSTLMLALLIGASMLTARRLRGGPLPR